MTARVLGSVATGVAGVMLMGALAVSASAQTPKSITAGVYTQAQAERGKETFSKNCLDCHEADRFTGPAFMADWNGKALSSLWDKVNSMPEDNPGSLKPQEYADILAFFLNIGQFPAGAAELPGDAAAMKGYWVEPVKK